MLVNIYFSSASISSFETNLEDVGELLEVAWAQQMRNVNHGLLGQQGQPLALNLQHLLAAHLDGLDVVSGQLAVGGVQAALRLEDVLRKNTRRVQTLSSKQKCISVHLVDEGD